MHALELPGRIANRLVSVNPCTNVYGAARTLLALGTMSTLLTNNVHELFPNIVGMHDVPSREGIRQYSFFCLLSFEHLELLRWLAIGILVVVVAGWRPRITGVMHWWVTFSVFISVPIIDGGDQLASILSGLLIPLTLGDSRKWHWDAAAPVRAVWWCQAGTLVTHSFLWVIQLQMATVYFHSSIAKLSVEEWVNGTAVYYWFTHPIFGMPSYLEPLVRPLLTHSASVVLLTWGTILFEILLFGALFMNERNRQRLLLPALFFHFAILLIHGLFSFFFAIAGGLVLYLRATSKPFALPMLNKTKPQPTPAPLTVAY
jgi:antimicrobial peptide system SdpB family protein